MQRHLSSIQSLRGIAVLLVVLLHVYAFEAQAGLGPQLLPYFSIFGASGVDLFFVISGFVMVYTNQNSERSFDAFSSFLYKRLSRIYPLYWLLTVLLLLGYGLFPQLAQRDDLAEVHFLKAMLLLPQESAPYLVVGWTLIHELYFYAVFSLFIFLDWKLLPHALLLWLFGVLVLSLTLTPAASPLLQLIAHPLTLEFILGCVVALLLVRGQIYLPKTVLLLGVLTLIGGWGYYHAYVGTELLGWNRSLLLGIPYSMIIYGATAIEFRGGAVHMRVFSILGDASYSIYLIHFLVISLLSKTWQRLLPLLEHSWIDNGAYILLCVSASVILGILCYRYIERPLIRCCRNIPPRVFRRQALFSGRHREAAGV